MCKFTGHIYVSLTTQALGMGGLLRGMGGEVCIECIYYIIISMKSLGRSLPDDRYSWTSVMSAMSPIRPGNQQLTDHYDLSATTVRLLIIIIKKTFYST